MAESHNGNTCPNNPGQVTCKYCRHHNDCEIEIAAQAGEGFFCGYGERRDGGENKAAVKVALKNNGFDCKRTMLDIRPDNREGLAWLLESMAVCPDGMQQDLSDYDAAVAAAHYLRAHKDRIAAFRKWGMTVYCMYMPDMSCENIPSMRIEEVDASKPWAIFECGGVESIAYLQALPHNQYGIII